MTTTPETGESEATESAGTALAAIEHIVVLMLENRSFDHMLGYLYHDTGNVTPSGQAFEGLTGSESNPGTDGKPVPVFPIAPDAPNAYFMPGADPGEGYMATNSQLFGSTAAPSGQPVPAMQGFVKDYAYTLGWEGREGWSIVGGTQPQDIMGCFTPEALPVLCALARGYAVCDHWFGSAPTETLPNRAFALAGTSQGHMDDKTKTFTSPSIFGSLTAAGVSWVVYGYEAQPLTKHNFPDITRAPAANFGLFADFRSAAADGSLAQFTFLEPSWSSTGNSQHPNYDVALGEQLMHDVYAALRKSPVWNSTLLIITYDEHGGCYDHVPPPWGATPPDNTAGEFGFDFTRFGPRVPTVLVSPLIPAGTVFRVPAGATPLDHTSILKTIEARWNLAALTARDAAAEHVGAALTLTAARTDDVLAGVVVPVSGAVGPAAGQISHLQEVQADLLAREVPAGKHVPAPRTAEEAEAFIRARTQADAS
ncbi:MAG TPA: alkaline phosphatase family protein [Actinocrinis sp.]|uniref:alkaline phosphatase family protein n=1 Tax=Actinocrinis sp. TaxID=1920516 RepID=UPI002DDD683B|nr:alkaline phosphatase family protein [Actinocrinis sp.]HEV2347521.1 alkaline phosphatase family protein [Actinocrinis sp.]